MFFACGIWCLADISSVNPSSEQTTIENIACKLAFLGVNAQGGLA